jgi:hypothetical protein
LNQNRGLEFYINYTIRNPTKFSFTFKSNHKIYSSNNLEYKIDDEFSLKGLIKRMDNFLNTGIKNNFNKIEEIFIDSREELARIKIELNKPFLYAEKLAETIQQHDIILLELEKLKNQSHCQSPANQLPYEEADRKTNDFNRLMKVG